MACTAHQPKWRNWRPSGRVMDASGGKLRLRARERVVRGVCRRLARAQLAEEVAIRLEHAREVDLRRRLPAGGVHLVRERERMRVERKIGRAHVWNSSHSQISYAVFCLKKKK